LQKAETPINIMLMDKIIKKLDGWTKKIKDQK
jgi:hypothetical protein